MVFFCYQYFFLVILLFIQFLSVCPVFDLVNCLPVGSKLGKFVPKIYPFDLLSNKQGCQLGQGLGISSIYHEFEPQLL